MQKVLSIIHDKADLCMHACSVHMLQVMISTLKEYMSLISLSPMMDKTLLICTSHIKTKENEQFKCAHVDTHIIMVTVHMQTQQLLE